LRLRGQLKAKERFRSDSQSNVNRALLPEQLDYTECHIAAGAESVEKPRQFVQRLEATAQGDFPTALAARTLLTAMQQARRGHIADRERICDCSRVSPAAAVAAAGLFGPRSSATDSSEQIVSNANEATTRGGLKGEQSTVGPSTGSNPSVLINPMPVSCGTGPVNGATCSGLIRGIARLGAACSRVVAGVALLGGRRVVGGAALLGECERGGGKRDCNREAQSFHTGHLVFSYPPTSR
jgi:hypothetical protein